MNTHNKCRGFTLVELLVVIAIIGVLIGLLLPAVQMVRESARRVDCLNRLKNQSLACLSYESTNQHLPPGNGSIIRNVQPVAWMAHILPYVEQENLYQIVVSDFGTSPVPFYNHLALSKILPIYQCGSDPSSGVTAIVDTGLVVATTSYQGVCGTNHESLDGVFYYDSKIRMGDIRDGLSNTLIIGERPPSKDRYYGWWYAGIGQDGIGSLDMFLGVSETLVPDNFRMEDCPLGPYSFEKGKREQCDAGHFWSYHPGGANFARGDGSVAFLSYKADSIIDALATRNGGETTTSLE